jgi:LiaF transmembrane domain
VTDRSRRVVAPGLLVGLWITTLGVIFLLDQLGIIPANISFAFVWPAILIAAGLTIILSTHSGARFWGVLLLVWGGVSISNELGFFRIHIGSLWPLVLIALGISMLLNSSGRLGRPWSRWPGPEWDAPRDPAQNAATPPHPLDDAPHPPGAPSGPPSSAAFFGVNAGGGGGDDATFDQAVILSGFKRRVTSQRFRFGKATAILGGFHIDFTRADIDGSRALLHIDTVFGGGEVRVPDNWRIVIEATAIAGAFVDETYPQPVSASTPVKELIVRGAAVFGGVTIKN